MLARIWLVLLAVVRGHETPTATIGRALHIIQAGEPRSASTFQFMTLCRAWQLKHIDVQCLYVTHPRQIRDSLRNAEQHSPLRRFVFKTHYSLKLQSGKSTPAHARQMKAFVESTPSCAFVASFSAGGRPVGWPGPRPVFEQNAMGSDARGWQALVVNYADLLGLETNQTALLVQYMRYFVPLRRCCGTQMSQDYRTLLNSKHAVTAAPYLEDIPDLAHPFKSDLAYNDCQAMNLSEVERLYRKTNVSMRFGSSAQGKVWTGLNLPPNYCSDGSG
ncbi:hypothetical protein T492DRAFT_981108 [Pavlovales sp. CCMP2436]|nr:hypothetical protein T492DRAFT_981108 [Pavlovales sp. CCMP2436]|mmetsp:Transcript_16489/g.39226  ORF Transcript_16489/g.39226 Transcript_16489/m.39226 type:complete len:275 (+) Transcript_16489:106-930(+)